VRRDRHIVCSKLAIAYFSFTSTVLPICADRV
jgi:hypothetical protein